MARNQFSSEPSGATPPDPAEFDLYDSEQMEKYQRATQDYIAQVVRERVEEAMGPHSKTLRDARWSEEYKAMVRQHGADKDFDKTMAEALDRVAESDGSLSIIEAYDQVDKSTTSRRKNEHLPEKFRDKKKGVGGLGQLMRHHEEKGTATPFGKGY